MWLEKSKQERVARNEIKSQFGASSFELFRPRKEV